MGKILDYLKSDEGKDLLKTIAYTGGGSLLGLGINQLIGKNTWKHNLTAALLGGGAGLGVSFLDTKYMDKQISKWKFEKKIDELIKKRDELRAETDQHKKRTIAGQMMYILGNFSEDQRKEASELFKIDVNSLLNKQSNALDKNAEGFNKWDNPSLPAWYDTVRWWGLGVPSGALGGWLGYKGGSSVYGALKPSTPYRILQDVYNDRDIKMYPAPYSHSAAANYAINTLSVDDARKLRDTSPMGSVQREMLDDYLKTADEVQLKLEGTPYRTLNELEAGLQKDVDTANAARRTNTQEAWDNRKKQRANIDDLQTRLKELTEEERLTRQRQVDYPNLSKRERYRLAHIGVNSATYSDSQKVTNAQMQRTRHDLNAALNERGVTRANTYTELTPTIRNVQQAKNSLDKATTLANNYNSKYPKSHAPSNAMNAVRALKNFNVGPNGALVPTGQVNMHKYIQWLKNLFDNSGIKPKVAAGALLSVPTGLGFGYGAMSILDKIVGADEIKKQQAKLDNIVDKLSR